MLPNWLLAINRGRSASGPRISSWPTISSNLVGRILAAKGACSRRDDSDSSELSSNKSGCGREFFKKVFSIKCWVVRLQENEKSKQEQRDVCGNDDCGFR